LPSIVSGWKTPGEVVRRRPTWSRSGLGIAAGRLHGLRLAANPADAIVRALLTTLLKISEKYQYNQWIKSYRAEGVSTEGRWKSYGIFDFRGWSHVFFHVKKVCSFPCSQIPILDLRWIGQPLSRYPMAGRYSGCRHSVTTP
jgi:hypothetical protein